MFERDIQRPVCLLSTYFVFSILKHCHSGRFRYVTRSRHCISRLLIFLLFLLLRVKRRRLHTRAIQNAVCCAERVYLNAAVLNVKVYYGVPIISFLRIAMRTHNTVCYYVHAVEAYSHASKAMREWVLVCIHKQHRNYTRITMMITISKPPQDERCEGKERQIESNTRKCDEYSPNDVKE